MNDLLYMGYASDYDTIKEKLLRKFPEISIQDASGDVHPYRLSIDLPDEQRMEYYKFIIVQECVAASLAINLLLNDPVVSVVDKELHTMVVQLLSELKEKKCTHKNLS